MFCSSSTTPPLSLRQLYTRSIPCSAIKLWTLSRASMGREVYYQDFEREANLLVVITAFVLIVSIILVNLLVAQLNQAYQHVYTDMQGAITSS